MLLHHRLVTLIQILDREDYRFVRSQDLRIEVEFRRKRMRIYRAALRGLAAEIWKSHQAQISNVTAAGAWDRYLPVVFKTATSFASVGKLWMAGILVSCRMPVPFDLARTRERLENFLTAPLVSA